MQTLTEQRRQLVEACRIAVHALQAAPDDERLGAELDAALAALHEFDSAHPELARADAVLMSHKKPSPDDNKTESPT